MLGIADSLAASMGAQADQALRSATLPLATFDAVAGLLGALLAHLRLARADDVRRVLLSLLPDVFVVVHVLPRPRADETAGEAAQTLLSEGLAAFDPEGRVGIARDIQARLAELIVDTEVQVRSVGVLAHVHLPC
jgi:hypothetical protein